MLRCLDNNVGLARFARPGAWNDPDMLEVLGPLLLPLPSLFPRAGRSLTFDRVAVHASTN